MNTQQFYTYTYRAHFFYAGQFRSCTVFAYGKEDAITQIKNIGGSAIEIEAI